MFRRFLILGAILWSFIYSGTAYAQQGQLWAPAYPGAVQCENSSWEDVSVFFSRDSYENIRAFYTSDYGKAPQAWEDADSKSALFLYYKPPYHVDPSSRDGVYIQKNTHKSAVTDVLKRLERLIVDGALDRQEFADIRRRYLPLEKHYFTTSDQRDKRGSFIPTDRLIFEQYEKRIDDYIQEADTWEENEEDIMAEYHSLISKGKYQEAMDLMQKGSSQSIEAGRRPSDRRVVDLWKECLAEMADHFYPVRIEIGWRK